MALELIFSNAAVELVDTDDDTIVWTSDGDDEFVESFPDEFLSPPKHGEGIIEWLVDNDIVSEDAADDIEIYEEFGDEEKDEDLTKHDKDDD